MGVTDPDMWQNSRTKTSDSQRANGKMKSSPARLLSKSEELNTEREPTLLARAPRFREVKKLVLSFPVSYPQAQGSAAG